MTDLMRVRLMLARFHGDDTPVAVGAIDQAIWDHWTDEDESAWKRSCEQTWGADPTDCEWREVWATFATQEVADAFETPVVSGEISQ